MSSFQIPKHYYQAVTELILLNEDQISQFKKVLQQLPILLSREKLISSTSKRLNDIGITHGEGIVTFIASLHSLLEEVDEDIRQQVLDDILDFVEKEPELPSLSDENKKVFIDRLSELLEASNALNIAAKAANVITENEHVFLESRILSDIRVIFQNLETIPTEAVIIHNLRITYRQGDDKKEFFVALDNSDLAKLGKQILRAELKLKSIEKILRKAEVDHLSIE
jgi:hypothetical protein